VKRRTPSGQFRAVDGLDAAVSPGNASYDFNVVRAEKSIEPVRVLFVDHTAQLGGGEIALRNLLNYLDPRRVTATVILCAQGPLVDQLERNNHEVHVLQLSSHIAQTRKDSLGWKSLLRFREIGASLAFVWRMARYIRMLKIDVVHTNSLKAHLLGGMAARLARRPLIWHLRDRIATDYLPRPAVLLVRVLSKVLPQAVIANSQATLETIIPKLRQTSAASYGFRVIHDGCVLPEKSEDAQEDGSSCIGMVGRISPWKGQHVFIKAAAIVSRQFPCTRFKIIGAPLFSELAYERELHQLAASLQLERNLTFTGFVDDIASAIARLQMVVHASTVGEPFGQVIIEGMAAGKPIIATRSGGIPEIVVSEVTGLMVPVEDERALADAMITLLRDPRRAAQMGAQGRERVRNFFTIERHALAIEQVYEDVLRSTRTDSSRLNQETLERA
jgi:glycosyltransferase involved in cell wall biosynthesis